MRQDTHCKFCGISHEVVTDSANPQVCGNGHETFHNPTPVSVLLLPVRDEDGRVGVVIGKRGIEPRKGLFGLPGGFVDPGDADFAGAALRELKEETGLSPLDFEEIVDKQALDMEMFWSMSDGSCILVFSLIPFSFPVSWALENFVPCAECPEIDIAWEPQELCFASHTEALRRWFSYQ